MDEQQMEQPYVYVSDREETEVESGEFDDLGVVPRVMEGYHAIFAARVRPALWNRANSTGPAVSPGQRGTAREILGQQIQFIASLYQPSEDDLCPNPSLRTLDLRFIGQGTGEEVRVALLGKAFDPHPEQARELALEFWEEVALLFPRDYRLVPAATEAEFEACFLGDLIDDIAHSRQIADIRRYEEFIPLEREEQVWEQDYLVYPFVWSRQALDPLPRLLRSLPGRYLVSASLRQTKLYEAEERGLSELYATFEELEKVNWLKAKVQGKIGMQLYTEYLRRLRRPFLLKIQIAGEQPLPQGLIHALGAGLTGLPDRVLQGEANDYVETSYVPVFPETSDELAVAKRNLKLLEHDFWGRDLPLAKYRRFRYLVDARWANCAFRVPISWDWNSDAETLQRI